MLEADTTTETKQALTHLGWAVVPAAIAAVAVLVQILEPYVSTRYEHVLFNTALFIGNCTLATWLWCAIARSRRTNTTVKKQQRRTLAVTERNDRAIQSAHRKLDRQAAQNDDQAARLDQIERALGEDGAVAQEVRHLRRLIMELNPSAGIGPSPYS